MKDLYKSVSVIQGINSDYLNWSQGNEVGKNSQNQDIFWEWNQKDLLVCLRSSFQESEESKMMTNDLNHWAEGGTIYGDGNGRGRCYIDITGDHSVYITKL